jgi:hypothetical protein
MEERGNAKMNTFSPLHFFNCRGCCPCMRAYLQGHVKPLQKSSPRFSKPPSLLTRLSPSPLPKWPLSRRAARSQGASNHPLPSRCVKLPPQPRASMPHVTFLRRVATAASPAPSCCHRRLGPPHRGSLTCAEPSPPLPRAFTPSSLSRHHHPGPPR